MNIANIPVYTVSQVNGYVKSLMDQDDLLTGLLVRGEISNYKCYPSGHHYFSLKDEQGSLRCVMFRGEAVRLRFRPANGMRVVAFGRISVFPRDGQYQLYCNELIEDGRGALDEAFERLRRRLEAEGLFDPANKQNLPRYPGKIALVTSPAGAAVRDMLRILEARWPLAEVCIIPVRVQGAEAPQETFLPDVTPLDINAAGEEELTALPGIGPVLARRIVEYRAEHGPFASVEDLTDVSGIGASKLAALEEETGLRDAAVAALGRIEGRRAVFAVLDSRFLMGSMGTAVGEKITRAAEYADKKRLPLVIFSASGGARMQEGIFSLMQMAKTAAAIQRFQSRGGLYISCLTHPTTGGVTASFASLGDIMLAEPGALIGFAGPRVIEQTIKEQLPEGFQRAEYLLDHGFLDRIVPRSEWRTVLSQLLALHEKGGRP